MKGNVAPQNTGEPACYGMVQINRYSLSLTSALKALVAHSVAPYKCARFYRRRSRRIAIGYAVFGGSWSDCRSRIHVHYKPNEDLEATENNLVVTGLQPDPFEEGSGSPLVVDVTRS